ncbi:MULTISPECIES: DUF3888 domain-containing protein [unclassified Clostridium]|uniref:DUF3888 domain-containing protein n=1 Tax=unclassified Clostridium TaxID=2614128 RepID=UPI0032167AF3
MINFKKYIKKGQILLAVMVLMYNINEKIIFGVENDEVHGRMEGDKIFMNVSTTVDLPHQPPKESTEELYQDVFLALLMPYIQIEVEKYYSTYLSQTPLVDPYSIYINSISRPNGYRSFVFDISLQVNPYIGPHILVGTDNIDFTVEGNGRVKVKKFEHIKSYDLPPTYEHIMTEIV